MNDPREPLDRPDLQAELARERNRIAADRSLLSFIRSSVLFMAVGVGLDQIIRALLPAAPNAEAWIYGLSLLLIGLSLVNLLVAAHDYRGEMQRLSQPEYSFTPRWSLAEVMGLTLLVMGFLAFLRLETLALS